MTPRIYHEFFTPYFTFESSVYVISEMIIREEMSMTQKASPLSSRRSARPADRIREDISTLKGCPIIVEGHPFSGMFPFIRHFGGYCTLDY